MFDPSELVHETPARRAALSQSHLATPRKSAPILSRDPLSALAALLAAGLGYLATSGLG